CLNRIRPRIKVLKPKRHAEENVGNRVALVILFAISALLSGSTLQRNADTILQAEVSDSGRQLVGTRRLISRVVRLDDGTAVQEPGLGTSHTVTHHLEGALAAADVGKNLLREFQVSDDKLTIIVRTSSPKEKQIRTLTWERVR